MLELVVFSVYERYVVDRFAQVFDVTLQCGVVLHRLAIELKLVGGQRRFEKLAYKHQFISDFMEVIFGCHNCILADYCT